jgi:hypothetical protein
VDTIIIAMAIEVVRIDVGACGLCTYLDLSFIAEFVDSQNKNI